MKKIFVLLIILLMPLVVKAEDKMVKVYLFEAGGCPYCEAEINYLKGLKSYNKKFTIEKKELYIDHVDWQPGKDYDLGVKVANAFNAKGFNDADYHATPFVIISDLYASSGYSTDLENIIDEAYEKGDADIVSCIDKGNDNCLDHVEYNGNTVQTSSGTNSNSNSINWTIITCTIILGATYIIKSNADRDKIIKSLGK